MAKETIEKFEALGEIHKGFVIEAAHASKEQLWASMCRVYNLPSEHCPELRTYILATYNADGSRRS